MQKPSLNWVSKNWKNLLFGVGSIIALSSLYLFKIGSLVRGDGFRESISYLGINGLANINTNISYGPVKFLQLLMVKIDEPNSTLLRIVSASMLVLSVIIFYRLLRKWHTPRIATLTSILFATSSYSLHMGRYSFAASALMLIAPSLLLFGTWLKSKKNVRKIIVIGPAIAFCLYIPGLYLIIAILGIIFWQRLLLAVQHMKRRDLYLGMCLTGIALLPLLISTVQNLSSLKSLSGFDKLLTGNSREALDAILQLPIDLFYAAEIDAYRWLTGTPILDIASLVLLALGIYAYVRGEHPLRMRLLGLGILATSLLVALSSQLNYALLIPLLYIVIGNGIAYLLQTWFTVFPRNPAARRTGIITISVLIVAISAFQTYRYFIVWPNTPETKTSLISPES